MWKTQEHSFVVKKTLFSQKKFNIFLRDGKMFFVNLQKYKKINTIYFSYNFLYKNRVCKKMKHKKTDTLISKKSISFI